MEPSPAQELAGRVAIITGGASGIGRAACLLFAAAGAKVVVADVDEAGGQATVARIGENACFVKTDVSSAADAAALSAAALARFGRIDILYNNAATTVLCNEHDRPVHELEEWIWDKMLAVCLKGVYLCSKYALPHMMAQKRGVVINTTSIDALIAEPGYDSYTAAKGGVIALTRSMAAEYAPYGIRVNVISPGYVITECQQWYHDDPQARAIADSLHLTRVGRPEDIANMALYLASDRAEFITGALIPVDGGFTAFKGAVPDTRTQA
ncbi:MAG TPA: glucose 1-dehydrogenase [Chthonomonadaceae bacterium]|nr:glucose 1-dehydrogenase [Chthonomonadaceae bacterium]